MNGETATRRVRLDEAHRQLVKCSRLTGPLFYEGIVRALAETLDVRWVLLCDLSPANPRRARTIAAWADGGIQENFEYDLIGTPCANVLDDIACYYPSDVAQLFPEDVLLEEMGVHSYLGVPLRSSTGQTLGLLAVLHDEPMEEQSQPHAILELFAAQTEAELERLTSAAMNERLGRIIEDAANETYVFDADTLKFELVNRGARENLGYAMDELRELTPVSIKPQLTDQEFQDLVAPLRTGHQSLIKFQTVHRRKDGTDYDVDVKLQLLRDGSKPVFYAAIEDITEREHSSKILRDTSRRLDTILNNTTMAVFLMDDRQECVYMNEAAERLTGYRFEETRGRPLHDVIHHTHPDGSHFPLSDCVIDRAFPDDNQVQGEEVFVGKDGTFFPVAYTASPIRDDDGKPVGTVIEARNIEAEIEAREARDNFNAELKAGIQQAIEARKAVEAQLLQAQKMDAIGKLTGGIAHDFNNLLQVIGGNLQLLLRDVAGSGREEQRVQNAMAGVARGAKLAAHLLAFSRKQTLEPKVVNLGRLIRGLDDMLRRTLGEGVEVETVVSGGLWNTFVDEAQVENAILNLAINARDAMEGRGKLTIEAGNALLDERYVHQHPEIQPGQYVMLAVTDTGCGIPAELIERVFEPFFTTKPTGKGTGLGLSMVYGLIKQSGGHIQIYSEIGQGTTVRMYLARSRQEEAVPESEDFGTVSGGTETILVVEDDDEVRATAVELLTELGYRVLRASDAMSGLAIIDSGVPIDLLFTDVIMPGPVQSRDMARHAQKRFPGIAVLFTSGYTENAIVHGGRLDDGLELLSKPYTRDALARKIRRCLEASTIASPESERPVGDSAHESCSRTVLLVEDEALVRMNTAEMLTDLGHDVVEASTAEDALEILESRPIDVLLTDIGLPGMSGDALASQVRLRWPGIQILIASGYVGQRGPASAELDEHIGWLNKPYDLPDLQRALAAAGSSPPDR